MRRLLPTRASTRQTARRLLGEGGFERMRALALERHAAVRSQSATPPSLQWPQRGAGPYEPPTPPLAVLALSRLGFGPRGNDVADFEALGGTGAARLENWLELQMDPLSITDTDCDSRIGDAGLTTLGKSFDQVWLDHVLGNGGDYEVFIRPFHETEIVTFLRAVYSRRQLLETMTRFWHDHFSIYGEEAGPMFMTYDRDVIRANAFGNFRTLLEGVAKHPVMLEYLDNKYNTYEPHLPNDGINENYARELLELHTLGAENYLGSMDPGDVPLDGLGRPIGYTDADVTAAARCLTGWTVSDRPWDLEVGNTGHFLYMHDWHDDQTDKVVLGEALTGKDVPLQDGHDLLDLLAEHPGTGRFIAGKLCRRLVADEPSQALVDAAAAEFTAHTDSPDQIARVLRVIVLSDEFRDTWGEKVKRPFEIITSAMRATDMDFPFTYSSSTFGLLWWLWLTGNEPFAWQPPDGYADVRDAWISSSPRVMTWRLCNWIANSYVAEWWGEMYMDAVEQTPGHLTTATQVVDYWIDRIFQRSIPSQERQACIDVMANGGSPDVALDWGNEWAAPDRLRIVVGLMLMLPSFLWL